MPRDKFTINYPKAIENFMKEQDLPNWYRGLSKFQLEAASDLHLNLKDDMQQETTHRTRDCLLKLGLDPPVSSKQIHLIMKLSKGQDLAFLWFLMDIYYKGACKDCAHPVDVYNVNEQICLSAIAHLDLIPTLRELDMRLPKQPSQKNKQSKKDVKKIITKQNKNISPYRQKLVRPKEQKIKPYHKGKNIVPNFSEYISYSDIYYQVPNEKNRWYANYTFNPGRRFLNHIMNEVIDQIFDTLSNGCDLNELLNTKYKNVMCLRHRGASAKNDFAKAQEMFRKKEALMAQCDPSAGRKEQSRKRINRDLSKEVDAMRQMNPACEKKPNLPIPNVKLNPSSVKDVDSPTFSFYFKAPTSNAPYAFNFPMIFKDLQSNRKLITQCINKAINMDCDIDLNVAIQMVCKEMWYKTVNDVRKAKALEEQKKAKNKKDPKAPHTFDDLDYYDPRDAALMGDMLKTTIDEIRSNPKFVLASLPDVHKFPILKEWIRVKYGFSYTPEEIAESVKKSHIVFTKMHKVTFKKPNTPRVQDFSLQQVITYACQPQLREKAGKVYNQYTHDVKYIIMDMARIFWEAMKPYQCTMGPPRETFFAYAPGNMANIFTFRPN